MAMDLKRVALAYFRGSTNTAAIFLKEALSREKEINRDQVKPYLHSILDQCKKLATYTNPQDLAEDALMYSTRLLNYISKYL